MASEPSRDGHFSANPLFTRAGAFGPGPEWLQGVGSPNLLISTKTLNKIQVLHFPLLALCASFCVSLALENLIEKSHCPTNVFWSEVRVPESHAEAVMSQELSHCHDRNPLHDEV